MNIIQIRKRLEQKKGELSILSRQLTESKRKLKALKIEIKASSDARTIIRAVAQKTQKQIEYHISNLVTLALQSVFPNPYEFKAKFILKRNKTECDMYFMKSGKRFDPMEETGGGVLDVASFALRASLWAISSKANANILIFDEPFKNINDETRELHKKTAAMVKMVCSKLNLQIIMITMIPEMKSVANHNIVIGKRNGVSKLLNRKVI